jgi:hypothetical protein
MVAPFFLSIYSLVRLAATALPVAGKFLTIRGVDWI